MRKINCTILISFILLSLLITIHVSTEYANAEVEGYETNLTNDTLSQGNPAIYGNRVVWTENTLEGGIANWEIFLYDLSLNGEEAKIRITNNDSYQLNPEIYGDIIVWEDNRNGNYDIYMYDLTVDSDKDTIPNYLDEDDDGDGTPDMSDLDDDPAEIRITDNPSHQEEPAIYGTKIVWVDKRYGNMDVFIYDLISGQEAIIAGLNEIGTPDPNNPDKLIFPLQTNPRIYGNKVVWQDDRFENVEIFMYNLSMDSDEDGVPNYLDDDRPAPDPAEELITSDFEDDSYPSIHGDLIVYSRMDNIYLYDLRTKTEYRLTNSSSEQKIDRGCSIYGTKVVWAYDNGSKDIYRYDLALDSDEDGTPNYRDIDTTYPDPALQRVTYESEKYSMKPVIFTNKIVWVDKRNSSRPPDIYMFTLTENLPPEITYYSPIFNPEIEEGEFMIFNISCSDPEVDDLNYTWFLDDITLSEEMDTYNFTSDYNSAGTHEVKVVVSDGEYHVEEIWLLYVSESDLPPFEITHIDPITNPTIVEGEEIILSIEITEYYSEGTTVTWVFPSDPTLYGQVDNEWASIIPELDYNGSNYERQYNITVEVKNGSYTESHTWILTVLYFEDADMDGYNDATEVTYGSDPLNISDTPPDLDGDFIVDGEDDDTDGDGCLDEHDAYPMDPNRQVSGKPDYSVEILIMIMALILVLAAVVLMPRVSKRRRR